MIVFFDLGTVCFAFFILMVAGMATVSEVGIWLSEHYTTVVIVLIIVSVIKTIYIMNEMNKELYEGLLCSTVDAVRMIPALIFLKILFQSFVELASEELFGFILNFIGTILGACIVLLPSLPLIWGTESLCSAIICGNDSKWLIEYITISLLGTGLQLLLFKLFHMI